MTLLQAWGDSLSLLKPQNLKLFLLVTFKSVIEVYKVLAHYWWWLYALMVVCCFITIPLTEIISLWAYQIVLFATIASTRPSLFQKDWTYFKDIMRYFLLIVPILLVLPYAWWPYVWYPNLIVSLYVLWVLFFLDSSKKIVSQRSDVIGAFVRALKMLVYNVPLFFLLFVVALLMGFALFGVLVVISMFLSTVLEALGRFMPNISIMIDPSSPHIINALLAPIMICLYTNIYIKKLHDQFDLYFKQPK